MKLDIIGLDPSMSNFGLVKGVYDIETGKVEIRDMILTETKKGSNKQVRQNSDDLRRATEIVRASKHHIQQASVVFAELPVGSQSSRGQTNYGVCLGILASIDKPLIQITPNQIKKLVGGKLTTSKQEVIEWAMERHPEAPWLTQKRKGETIVLGKNEHLADAIAAIYVGLQEDQFRQLVDSLKNFIKVA
ncbi:hypothetical protein [Photobacterium ganghwense]|uniref:Uncharacterized protein n=1 Tax=Photobacterium ganghwense TaxID=320778 RepID=A0A0J1HF28_9GAMM|nr:hypothetical protein [Photobacterium ganghwense]KLV10225.1 hypothetical protein ABT57_06535 [Photobacterium ganghwense]PSU09896.1 hypothetical protein C9I92_10370 [Photobacterium ganghwense]QSV17142.1 hypothetical protein FH974_19585 [Photobacterium ganghwense]